jgi:hypothetical protein
VQALAQTEAGIREAMERAQAAEQLGDASGVGASGTGAQSAPPQGENGGEQDPSPPGSPKGAAGGGGGAAGGGGGGGAAKGNTWKLRLDSLSERGKPRAPLGFFVITWTPLGFLGLHSVPVSSLSPLTHCMHACTHAHPQTLPPPLPLPPHCRASLAPSTLSRRFVLARTRRNAGHQGGIHPLPPTPAPAAVSGVGEADASTSHWPKPNYPKTLKPTVSGIGEADASTKSLPSTAAAAPAAVESAKDSGPPKWTSLRTAVSFASFVQASGLVLSCVCGGGGSCVFPILRCSSYPEALSFCFLQPHLKAWRRGGAC